jgi:type IX secretion system PorP/SprF family membrane protein
MAISLFSHQSAAQFIPYSQYHNTPVLTNPSQAGLSDFTQVTFHYRRSRAANYEIPSVSLMHPFYRERDGRRMGGLGVNVISQKAGPGGMYNVTGALGTFAYNIHLSSKHHISAGLQGGMINKKLDPSGITTDAQFNFGAFDPSLQTGENFRYTSVTKPIINSGFTWTFTDSLNQQKAALGIAFSNMNRPSYDFISDNSEEPITYTVTGQVQLMQRGRTSIHPTFRYIGGINGFANIGALIRYSLAREHQEISIGGWYKTTKALVAGAQYNTGTYTVSASMDFSAASGLEANINNAFELSVSWRLKRKAKIKREVSSSLDVLPLSTTPETIKAEEPQRISPAETEQESLKETVEEIVTIVPVIETSHEITPDENFILKTHLTFKLGSADLSTESVHFIETQLVKVLKDHPDKILHITGHSCTIGDKSINEKISLHRAEAVAKVLLQQGIPEKQITTTGMDFQQPVASNGTEEGRQKNRRVEFVLMAE